jgi:hypothetical protein
MASMPWPVYDSFTKDLPERYTQIVRGERVTLQEWRSEKEGFMSPEVSSDYNILLSAILYLEDGRQLYKIRELSMPIPALIPLLVGYRESLDRGKPGSVPELDSLRTPTLVVAGERDIFPKSHVERHRE